MTNASHVVVTAGNASNVRGQLIRKGGFLLTVWGALNWKYTITLYDRPILRVKPEVAICTRHDGDNATNPLDDREYRFGRKTDKQELQLLFENFEGEDYRLGIAPEWGGVNWPNFAHGKYFYVPLREQLPETFAFILKEVLAPHDPPISDTDVEGMVAYIMRDLDTKEVVRRIVAAGMVADAASGFG